MALGLFTLIVKLSELLELKIDEATLLLIQVLAIVLAIPYRIFLHPTRVDATTRHIVAIGLGFYFSYYLHSWNVVILLIQALSCYVLIVSLNTARMPKVVFTVALGILIVANFREFLRGSSGSNEILSLMIFTEKITSLGWSIHDGLATDRTKLSDLQNQKAVRRIPTIVEYISYLFHFQGLATGPFCFYKDYIDFIEGKHLVPYKIIKDGKEVVIHKEPPVTAVVLQKIVTSIMIVAICAPLTSIIPLEGNLDESVLKSPFIYRMLYSWACLWFVIHPVYFLVWTLADTACNASGFGFNGYDTNGTPRWDLLSNINLKPYLLSSNLKLSIDNWHMSANRWLKYVSYERLPYQKQSLTFLLSLVWHGFLPGYIWFYIGGVTLIFTQKQGRYVVRPHFTTSRLRKFLYDLATWAGHWIILSYLVTMFQFRDNARIVKFGRANYFWGQIVMVILIILFHLKKPPKNLDSKDGNQNKTSSLGSDQDNSQRNKPVKVD
ncbi:lysophospholipid acyltransferase 2-like isoform X1 [Ptychodera flava]|uniref:lysophospholipid acyltransferase 2-like isoform X1 n=1 Tax=Ptychodera flava TaxID=63121 RepID=UPI00396A372E